MIHVVIGTKAQLIKMAPIMRHLQDRSIEFNYISTGQHRSTMSDIHANFSIRGPDIRLYDGPDITSVLSMVVFGTRILWRTLLHRSAIFRQDGKGIVLVHGDTFSTLLGALMAKVARLNFGHVESGLRSFNLLAPFPEEIIRIATFRLTNYYFCPGAWAIQNIQRRRGIKVNTEANTLSDSLRLAMPIIEDAPESLSPETSFRDRLNSVSSKISAL